MNESKASVAHDIAITMDGAWNEKLEKVNEFLIKRGYDPYSSPESMKGSINKWRKRNHIFVKKLESGGMEGNWTAGWYKPDGETSIYLKNQEESVSYEDVRDQIIGEMKKYAPKYPEIILKQKKDPHCLVIDPADLHIGKLAVMEETDNEYNIKIAKERCMEGCISILSKTQGFNIEKVYLIIGNDILHIDHPHRKTTANTPQDTDGMWHQAFQHAKDLYVQVLELLAPHYEVEVVYNPSNHDYQSGYMLADTLSSWFNKVKTIKFDTSINHRKYFEYGNSLIATSHGDGAKMQDMPLIMASEVPEMWARTKYRYCYLHHIHHKDVTKFKSSKDYIGATVEYLRSPSGTDGWHHRNGYIGYKAIEGFVHSKENGQIGRFTHYF